MNLLMNTYTVESQLDVPCIQGGGSFCGADDSDKILKGSVHFHHKSFILEKNSSFGMRKIRNSLNSQEIPAPLDGNVGFKEDPGNPHL